MQVALQDCGAASTTPTSPLRDLQVRPFPFLLKTRFFEIDLAFHTVAGSGPTRVHLLISRVVGWPPNPRSITRLTGPDLARLESYRPLAGSLLPQPGGLAKAGCVCCYPMSELSQDFVSQLLRGV